jgi:hypothetical protein
MMNPVASVALRSLRIASPALVLLGAVALGGCSFSASSQSIATSSDNIAKSSGTASESSSRSSEQDPATFAGDVEEYTQAYVTAGGASQDFLGGVGDLARQRGISDWEADPGVWQAIGRGLGRSTEDGAAISGYASAWTGGDAVRIDEIERGIGEVR